MAVADEEAPDAGEGNRAIFGEHLLNKERARDILFWWWLFHARPDMNKPFRPPGFRPALGPVERQCLRCGVRFMQQVPWRGLLKRGVVFRPRAFCGHCARLRSTRGKPRFALLPVPIPPTLPTCNVCDSVLTTTASITLRTCQVCLIAAWLRPALWRMGELAFALKARKRALIARTFDRDLGEEPLETLSI